jgi:hypothetical protein
VAGARVRDHRLPVCGLEVSAADFVAAYGLHAALIVGDPLIGDACNIPALVEQLPTFKVRLAKDGDVSTRDLVAIRSAARAVSRSSSRRQCRAKREQDGTSHWPRAISSAPAR